MRITQRSVALLSYQGLQKNLSGLAKLQQQLSSGKQISSPSDSPTGTNIAMRTRGDLQANAQAARNVSDGKAWLAQVDSSLQGMTEMVQRVRDLTVQALSTGGSSTTSQQAISSEVSELHDALLGQANQTVQGRPVFGGVTGGSVAYDSTGAWVGQAGAPVTRRVSDTETVRVDTTGPEAFGDPASGKDLFSVVAAIAKDSTADPAALQGHLDDLDAVLKKMATATADVGARQARVDTAEQTVASRALDLQSSLSDVEDIDMAKTITDLQMQQVGYQAALSATAKALQPTLMDFLR